jgi:hypothetical protein
MAVAEMLPVLPLAVFAAASRVSKDGERAAARRAFGPSAKRSVRMVCFSLLVTIDSVGANGV